MSVMQEFGKYLYIMETFRDRREITERSFQKSIMCIEATVERCFLQSHPEAAGENLNNLKLHMQ